MSERLHYFTEATTPVSFDCDDSDIDSDLDDLSRRPLSDTDRAKQHARQLQLWSDEARRRRSLLPPPPSPASASPRRRPSSASLHDVLPPSHALHPLNVLPAQLSAKITASEMRPRVSNDRQQSNLSERSRHPSASRRVARSQSAKNLRIRVTPSSSSKSLLSDIESESGQPLSAPHSPRATKDSELLKPTTCDTPIAQPKTAPLDSALVPIAQREDSTKQREQERPVVALTLPTTISNAPTNTTPTSESTPDSARPHLSRRMSFTDRVKRFPSLKKFLRR